MISNKIYVAFSKFINDLDQCVGDKFRYVRFYSHLCSKISESHNIAIEKNCQLIRKFIDNNTVSINSHDFTLLEDPIISYSEKVYIDMKEIFENVDPSIHPQVWDHILSLNYLCSQNEDSVENDEKVENALTLLKNHKQTQSFTDNPFIDGGGMEGQFDIEEMLKQFGGEKLAKSVKDIMESDNFKNLMTDVKSKIETDEIDISGLQQSLFSNDNVKNMMNDQNIQDMMKNINPNINGI